MMKSIANIILISTIVLILLAGCIKVERTETTTITTTITTTTIKPGTCITDSDCKSFCISNITCEQYKYFHIESKCEKGKCLCRCVEDKLPQLIPPEGNEFVYEGKTYIRTNKITDCNGDIKRIGNVTIWVDIYNGYIYSPYEIDIGKGIYKCYRWFQEPGVIIRLDKKRYGQGRPVKISTINIDIVNKTITYPIIERFDKNWTEIKRVLCPCNSKCNETHLLSLNVDETKKYEWNGREEYCNGSELVSKSAPVGRYRIKVYVNGNDTIYSREFDIKPNVKATVTTDKDVYTSQEIMNIEVNISSGGDIENVSLYLVGISTGQARGLNEKRHIDIKEGKMTLNFNYLIPYCSVSGCSIIKPGEYTVGLILVYNEDIIGSAKKKVRIEPKQI